jgi:hypothetical protein
VSATRYASGSRAVGSRRSDWVTDFVKNAPSASVSVRKCIGLSGLGRSHGGRAHRGGCGTSGPRARPSESARTAASPSPASCIGKNCRS